MPVDFEGEIVVGVRVYYRARHEHHLWRTSQRDLDDPELVIPERVLPVRAEIPAWLRPSAMVLEGECFRESIVQQEVRREASIVKYIPLREPAWERDRYDDPALVLGHYVLAGWDDREMDTEQHRRHLLNQQRQEAVNRQRTAANARRRFWPAVVLAAAAEVFGLTLSVGGLLAGAWLTAAGGLVALAGAGVGAMALYWWMQSRLAQPGLRVMLSGIAAMVSGAMGAQLLTVGLMLPAWAMVGVGIVLLLAVLPLAGLTATNVQATIGRSG